MSAVLKRRFNFEQIDPIADRAKEISLVDTRTKQALKDAALPQEISAVDQRIINLLVTIVRDLRRGETVYGNVDGGGSQYRLVDDSIQSLFWVRRAQSSQGGSGALTRCGSQR
ncbi:hypothetical protein [Corynebacterium cystitidis]|uniref:hypothetical protein n=1 Tax=Corynebacterium cystitidis TaxID=35757 RepID=UPI0027BAD311|nr:hypothetical protein [Corynebacterium cystitidis]